MNPSREIDAIAPIFISIAMFAMVFGIVYLYKRERMAMIERGMDPRKYKQQSAPYQNLKWGLLLIGSGMGLFLAYLLDYTVFKNNNTNYDHSNNVPIYFALVAIFGGIGLFLSFLIERNGKDKAE